MGRFDDQVAIVTGAGSGTGAAIATQLAKEGASVACTDLDGADETAALLGERGRAVRLDVADAGSVARLMAEVRETYGRLDALFNSAGVDGMVRPLTDLSEELTVAERTCRVNFLRPFDTGRAVCYSDQPAESAGPRLGAGFQDAARKARGRSRSVAPRPAAN
jgi:2-hydroxycyclohexanecarboxyl-CoA dehydrogenase